MARSIRLRFCAGKSRIWELKGKWVVGRRRQKRDRNPGTWTRREKDSQRDWGTVLRLGGGARPGSLLVAGTGRTCEVCHHPLGVAGPHCQMKPEGST